MPRAWDFELGGRPQKSETLEGPVTHSTKYEAATWDGLFA